MQTMMAAFQGMQANPKLETRKVTKEDGVSEEACTTMLHIACL
jgi:hypothetical protein